MELRPLLGAIWKAVEGCDASVTVQGKNTKLRLKNEILRAKLCDAIVTMVQATDFWKSNNPADGLYRA